MGLFARTRSDREPAPAAGQPAAVAAPKPDDGARRARQQQLVASLGAQALQAQSLDALMRAACTAAAEALDATHAGIFERVADRAQLAGRAGHGWAQDLITSSTVSLADSHAGYALATGEPVVVESWATEARFAAPEMLSIARALSSIAIPIVGSAGAFGVIDVHAPRPNAFDLQDVFVLQGLANVVALAVERRQSEDRNQHQALHDALTGLPNRTLFEDRLSQALASARRHRRTLAVLFLDVDNFKRVNDMLGHGGGDALLREISRRADGCIRASDTLARFGGDEFAILLHEADGVQAAKAVAARVLKALAEPVDIEGRRVSVTASIGIALGGGYDSRECEEIVRNSDLAMYAAKAQGKARFELYAPQMYDAARRRTEMISDLERAIAHDEFVVHYQPIVALDSGAVAGVEALVRWNHPTQGLLSPAQFLPLAEETEQIGAISRLVLRKACIEVRRWEQIDPARSSLTLNVNLAAQQIKGHDLVPGVRAVLEEAGLPAEQLVLEVTEHVLVSNEEGVIAQLRALKRLGVRVAVDDFGTGYSALSYLQRFPIDVLKIDKSFVDTLGESEDSDHLVEGIINLAHVLKLETIAEGIETAEQERALRAMRSEFGQGYRFAKPLSAEQLETYLRDAVLLSRPPARQLAST